MMCDFCSTTTGVRFSYPAHDFEFILENDRGDRIHEASHGAWSACAACAALIERQDVEALARRNPAVLADPEDEEAVRFTVALQAGFFLSRTGPAVEVA